MKLSWCLFLSSLYCTACAASESTLGYVYLWDSSIKSKHTRHQSVDPETARLIFAQRLGLSRYHTLKNAKEEVIEQLNQYGGKPQQLFGGDRESNNAHTIIWVEGVKDAESIVPSSSDYSEFTISNPPPMSSNVELLKDFLAQAESLPKRPDPLLTSYNSDIAIAKVLEQEAQIWGDELNIRNHISFLLVEGLASAEREYHHRVVTLTEMFKNLLNTAKRDGFSITIVLMPPSPRNTKRSANPYGSYSLPSKALNEPRRQNAEAILSSPAPAEASLVSNLSSMPNTPDAHIYAKPVLGILPVCFDSISTCESTTRNCTGHGACHLARKGEQRAGGKGKYNDCYSCACKPTVEKNGDGGIKTTNWGGPACQKKDVVIPFWLFAGSTVGLVFLISTGIGMLYSMGNEELPSVIGAGVSGPTRK
ncbi:hypothetical protein K432DRAFT_430419 [Lepidopterella palustris CBS 459.81]|uniref:DUF3844 domain-containing protein n=1 Tax=Lepidopterella palustris CBS 459.81 TaxID=1314670 RepID=A0A8E2J8Y6_9PEZI|nr:hypothetical protein K432DRAFT_430419 [Lepidopterella palustris CBS 459.81]